MLEAALAYLPEVFQPPEQRPALQALATQLSWVPAGIFESRLGWGSPELAFAAGISTQDRDFWPLIAPFVARSCLPGPSREPLLRALANLFSAPPPWPQLWLEWALPAGPHLPYLDGLYLQADLRLHPVYSLRDWKNWFAALYQRLTGRDVPSEELSQVEEVLFGLPEAIPVSYVGVMPARDHSLKLCLCCPQRELLRPLIQRLDLAFAALQFLWDHPGRFCGDYWILNLDLGPLYKRRWGLEAYLYPQHQRNLEQVEVWLNWLKAEGLCTPEQRMGILRWQQEALPWEAWPEIAEGNYKCLNHIKLTSQDHSLSLKAYLFFSCRYLRQVPLRW